MSDSNPFSAIVQNYFEQSPVQAARTLETMDEEEVVEVFKVLPPVLAAKAIRELQSHYAATLLTGASAELVTELVRELEPEHAAAIFLHLPSDTREEFMKHLSPKQRKDIREQLTFPEDSVGRLMSTRFISFKAATTVRAATDRIRRLAKKRASTSYLYVVDEKQHLLGVINMRDMLVAEPTQTLEEIMQTEMFTLHAFTDREEAAVDLGKRRYFAAPVVDGENRMLGIIRAEQLISELQGDATEDIQRMFGAGGDEKAFSPILFSLKNRLPWLHVNLLTAFMAAGVVAAFEDIIAQITVLAVFLPVVAGQGGNGGAQSLAIVMRGLVMREIPREKSVQLVVKETLVGLVAGLVTGFVTAIIAWFWHGNAYLGLVVGLGMIVTMLAAGLAGSSIPLLMRRFGLDPAQCSNIILTTVTDVVGFFAFLGFAVMFKDKLL
jgi:magnesium transporter